MADTLDEKLESNALAPKRVRGDSGEVEVHSLKEQMELDRYLKSQKATATGKRGFKVARLIAPDAL